MMWHGRVRTELRTLSAAPLNLGSGFSRETPALDSLLSHKESKAYNETSHKNIEHSVDLCVLRTSQHTERMYIE